MNDKNVAVRIPWELWQQLDFERAQRELATNKKTTLSDIVREALENYKRDNNEH